MIWLNGKVLPLRKARIGVEDRGFQFADGVYEVVRIYNGRLFALDRHLDRLERSCAGITLPLPVARDRLAGQMEHLVARSRVRDGMLYLQITRGEARRNHVFPKTAATVLFYVRQVPPMEDPAKSRGLRLHAVRDDRWNRCWIKSIALLPNVLAKNEAVAAGADEAVFVNEGWVSECSSSNIFIVAGGMLITPPVGPKVLPGITRGLLLELARRKGVAVVERPFSEAEALAADEVFITSTTREAAWVSHWNGRQVGAGRCGPVMRELHAALVERISAETA